MQLLKKTHVLLLSACLLMACGESKNNKVTKNPLYLKETLGYVSDRQYSSWLLSVYTTINNQKTVWLLHESGHLWYWLLSMS